MKMNKPLLYPAFIILLLAGCRQREDLAQLKAINQSLQTANGVIQESLLPIIYEFEEKAREMEIGTYVAVWKPKAIRIENISKDVVAQIEELKKELLQQSDGLKKETAPLIDQLYSPNGAGYKLMSSLVAFKDSLPAIILADEVEDSSADSYLKTTFNQLFTNVSLLRGYSDSLTEVQKKQYTKHRLEDNFTGSSAGMALVILNKMENDLLTATSTFMNFCLVQTVVLMCGYPSSFSAVATLSSSYVKQGQIIEVNAGLGKFNTILTPRITMNGKEIKLGGDETAVHRFTASGKPGEHSVTLKIEFTKPDGTLERISKELKYIIADEK